MKNLIEILEEMRKLQDNGDTELDHVAADELLCEALLLLGQDELVLEYRKIEKWYA